MLRPLRDRVIVKPFKRRASSIIDAVLYERPNIGVVVAVGPGKRLKHPHIQPLDVKIGDTVRWGEFVFPEYFENGEKYLVLQEADIAGVVAGTSCT